MKTDKLLNQTVKMGVAPLSIDYHSIKLIETGAVSGFRTVLKINSVELGTLLPEQYRVVTNRNVQSVRLATWCFKNVLKEATNILRSSDGFISVYFPAKMLLKGEIDKLFSKVSEENFEYIGRLCIEFSSEILLEDREEVISAVNQLKQKFGVVTMLSEFGDEFCPVLRLNGLPIDYVVLDKSICNAEMITTPQSLSVIKLVNDLSMNCIIEFNNDANLRESAFSNGCRLTCDAKARTAHEVIA